MSEKFLTAGECEI